MARTGRDAVARRHGARRSGARAWDVLVSTKGDALNDTYAMPPAAVTGGTRRFWKHATRAVYPSIERDGLGGSATAWFDFGNSLDMGRAVDLEYAGRYHLPHESVKLHVFDGARSALCRVPRPRARVASDRGFTARGT